MEAVLLCSSSSKKFAAKARGGGKGEWGGIKERVEFLEQYPQGVTGKGQEPWGTGCPDKEEVEAFSRGSAMQLPILVPLLCRAPHACCIRSSQTSVPWCPRPGERTESQEKLTTGPNLTATEHQRLKTQIRFYP